ncbi:MAG: MBL fold metallo-hydrolase [Clostridia bacterium]|nr:MBL fold metallo-hydrolase [Clostridia bacterium]
MKLYFYGAARAVTGSCYCLEINGKRILIDCGLKQGQDDNVTGNELPFYARDIDYVIVTHAHIDHSGRLPLLVKNGYSGQIFATRLTAKLLGIMLPDSAYIQERDAEWDNQKSKRAGRPQVEPLYTIQNADETLKRLKAAEYNQEILLCEGVRFRFSDAGHLLGSACIELWATENGVTKKIVFTGDLGNIDQPIIRNPELIREADYLVTESTYGDRSHEMPEDYTKLLAEVFERVFSRGGNVIIPAFAVGRAQELLYFIREMKSRKMVKSFPDFHVYLDSPLARAATRIFSGDLLGYLDADALDLINGGDEMFIFPGLELIESGEDSKMLNEIKTPKVIISASGMCDAGRIRHHLKHNLWRPESAVVFVGYQAGESLGRRLLDGAKRVKVLGEEIAVNAEIVKIEGMSSHADREHLLSFAENFAPMPGHVFVTHGDREVTELFATELRSRGFAAHAPELMEVYDLAANRVLVEGEQVKKRTAEDRAVSPAYAELQGAARYLQETIAKSKGMSNRELRRLAEQIKKAVDKWKS